MSQHNPPRGSAPPPPPSPRVTLLRLRPGQRIRGTVISRRPFGVFTHYDPSAGPRGRSVPHESDGCPYCLRGLGRPVWHGYVVIRRDGCGRPSLLEITADAARGVWAHLTTAAARGTVLTAERPGDRPNGRVRITLDPHLRRDPAELPPDPDAAALVLDLLRLDPTVYGAAANVVRLTPEEADRGEGPASID